MSDYQYAIDAAHVPVGQAVRVQVDDLWIAVSNDNGTFFATDEICPHAGGHLGGGDVCDGCVVCPVHHWPWDLNTGLTDPNMPYLFIKRYPCEIRDGKVYVDIDSPQLPPGMDTPVP